jgi:hypothetical protein
MSNQTNETPSQSWDAWHGVDDTEPLSAIPLATGRPAVAAEVMGPGHPLYAEWPGYTSDQLHQGT